jgi:hypothetical protein
MGRPLNKKYFGNRNLGSASTAADNGLGGKRVASVTIDTPGSYTTATTVTFSDPDKTLLGAVTATGTIVYEALSAVASGTMVGYSVGDLLTVTTAGGSAIFRVATIGGTGGDDVLTLDFTAGGNRGSFTSLAAGAQATTTADGGTGCELTVTYRVKSITITEPGSGYTNATDAAITFAAGAGAGTVVMESDGQNFGNQNPAGTNENSITMTARLTGGTAVQVDIIKQVSGRRFKVTDGTRTGIITLKSSVATAAGEGSIRLVDTDGGTYFATKITSRKATITRGTGTQTAFVTGTAVQWNMTAATASSLLVDNA